MAEIQLLGQLPQGSVAGVLSRYAITDVVICDERRKLCDEGAAANRGCNIWIRATRSHEEEEKGEPVPTKRKAVGSHQLSN